MKKVGSLQFVLMLFLLLISSLGCSPRSRVQEITPISQVTHTQQASVVPQATQTATITPVPLSASDSVLKACSLTDQKTAMLPGEVITTDNLSVCYNLSLTISDEGKQYSGSADVTYTNKTDHALSEIYFRTYPNASVIYGGRLTVLSASIDGNPVHSEEYLEDKSAIRIPLSTPLSIGQTTTIHLEFTGNPPIDMPQSYAYGIFNLSTNPRILTMANWYPILAEMDAGQWEVHPVIGVGDAVVSTVGLYRATISGPEGWKVVSTGRNIAPSGQYLAVSGPVRDFTVVASPSFVTQEQDVNGAQIRHWAIAGLSDADHVTLTTAADSFRLYNEDFGAYPYNELDIVDVPLKNASGVEYPGLILIGSDLYRSSDSSEYLRLVVAHEMGHQWWYGVVGNDVLEYPWLDEGLTTYTSLLYFEKLNPSMYRNYLNAFKDSANGYPNSGISEPVTNFKTDERAYSDVVYLKTAVFFSELRKQIGDSAFFEGLRNYYSQEKYQVAKPENLLSTFEQSCHCDLSELYKKWGALPK
jgi:aminopeptidase N